MPTYPISLHRKITAIFTIHYTGIKHFDDRIVARKRWECLQHMD